LVTVPLTVNEEEPLVPVVKLRPLEEASVRVPCDAESVSESAFEPAAASVIEIALLFPLENVNEPFSLREPVPGAEIAGALKAVTVSDTLVEAAKLSVGSETDTANESAPEYRLVG
jgi:hypothetical protein